MTTQTIGVIGLGYVGQPTVAAMATVGYDVVGMDIDQNKISKLADTYQPTIYEPGVAEAFARCRDRICFTSSYEEVMLRSQAVCITVGTPLDRNGVPDYRFIQQAVQNLGRHLRQGQTLIIRSTVAPGTTMKIARDLEKISGMCAGKDFYVSFCPERTIEGIALYELFNLPNIIGGFNAKSAEMAKTFMEKLGTTVIIVSSPIVAELCKLADNTYRVVNIAFANEFGSVCEKAQVDAYEVVQAVNSTYDRTSIFRPGLGAGGPCLSKDPLILGHFAKSADLLTPIIDSSVEVNQAATNRVEREVETFLKTYLLPRPKLAFLGIAFKGMPETDDFRGSVALDIYQGLTNSLNGIDSEEPEFCFFDPIVSEFNGHEVNSDLGVCVAGANVLMFLNDHPALRNISLDWVLAHTARPLLIVDAWHNLVISDQYAFPSDVTYIRIGDGR